MKHVLCVLALVTCSSVFAADFDFSFGFSERWHRHRHRHDRHDHGHGRVRVYVDGHYETRYVDEVVRGTVTREWVEPILETCTDERGHSCVVVKRKGYFKVTTTSDYVISRPVQVWVPGCYVLRR